MDLKSSDKDLPLMANVCDVLVNHYIFQLICSFEERHFYGHVLVELMPQTDYCSVCTVKLNSTEDSSKLNTTEDASKLNATDNSRKLYSDESFKSQTNTKRDIKYSKLKDFIFILDCSDIIVHSVSEVLIKKDIFEKYKFKGTKLNELTTTKLNFVVEKWSLKIWKPGIICTCNFPRIVKIDYQTIPGGQSLLWVKDQDCRPAVYTYGAWINNRSLYPCQEPPTAMATWEAYISVIESAVVLMSGDNTPLISSNKGVTTYYYYTKMKLPLSTLALAVGFWNIDQQQCQSDGNVTFRICAAPSLLSKAVEEFTHYASLCLRAAESLLGLYPFPRLDFLIVPRGFCSLGMASPNIVFLSQSLLSNNQSMCCRIAHEIAHAWFGLMIGALDWTEEWLSEGFATFMEDLIHTKALSMDHLEERQYCEIKAHFRLNTLLAEVRNTEEELQVLRPNKGEIKTENVDGVDAVILKNGRNSEKAFMQVHYIKGYFLLKYLSDLVGLPEFLKFLNLYIMKYKGQLVESTEMLAFFIETFPEICNNTTVDKIASDWLHTAGIPKELLNFELSFVKTVFQTTMKEAKKWKSLNMKYLKKNPKRKKYDLCEFSMLSSEKLLVLLDELLNLKKIAYSVLKHLEQFYDLESQDAEVRHKWCELIIKHRYHPGYACVKNFLLNDLAMGIYLYGELILNGTSSQKQLAEDSFSLVREEMEPNCIITIEQMLETAVREML